MINNLELCVYEGGVEGVREGWGGGGFKKRSKVCVGGGGGRGQGKNGGMRAQTPL